MALQMVSFTKHNDSTELTTTDEARASGEAVQCDQQFLISILEHLARADLRIWQ